MLKNYFLLAWRSLRKSRVTATINITGLSLGLAVVILIAIWVTDELGHDKNHSNFNTLGQVYTSELVNGKKNTFIATALPVTHALRANYSEDIKAVSLGSWKGSQVMAVGDKKISDDGMYVEKDFPAMFGLNIEKGNINGLTGPASIFIASSLATSLFESADPVGQTIRINNRFDATVTGVYTDLPENSTFYGVKYLGSWQGYETLYPWIKNSIDQWDNHSFQCFVQIRKDDAHAFVTNKISGMLKPHFKDPNWQESLTILPMKDWYLRSEFKDGVQVGGRIRFVWLFGSIGIFVLLLACINFMNLSTARSEKRAKEVGIRKAMGSQKRELVMQFLGESLMVTVLALCIALMLVWMAMPWFNTTAGKNMSIPWNMPLFWICVLGFTFITGLLAGSYPAFYLSAFNPVKVFRGAFKAGKYAAIPRKVLVVLQFTVSIALIIGTIVVQRQIRHGRNRPVGFEAKNMIQVILNTPDLKKNYDMLRHELMQSGTISDMAQASSPITGLWSNQSGYNWRGKDPNYVANIGTVAVSHDYGNTAKWTIIRGRDFSRHFSDSASMILNESAARLMNFQNGVGETVQLDDRKFQVTGIVKDMVMQSPFQPVQPTAYMLSSGNDPVALLRISPDKNIPDALASMQEAFKKYDPAAIFDYKFVDELHGRKFASEERVGKLSGIFAALAILISCLGIFGLASFVAEQRTKEIGIRKILGASVYSLWSLLSKDFCWLVSVSFLLAAPLSWYFMSNWLQNYEYRTGLAWWIFVVAFAAAFLLTLTTVSTQAIRAATSNAVKSLKSE